MQMTHPNLTAAHLRLSLKRGLARQAVAEAARQAPDMAHLVRQAAEFRPNPKALARMAARLSALSGVVRVASGGGGKALSVTARSVRDVQMQVDGAEVFRETGLIYHRLTLRMAAGFVGFQPAAVSFSPHALERLVERSHLPLDRPLLPLIDQAAVALFRQWDRKALIEEEGAQFCPAEHPGAWSGVWAGGIDEMTLEADWGLASRAMALPTFSVRTFLSEAQMRPTLWLRWRDDPTCRLA